MLKQIFLFAWIAYVTIMSIFLMFTESFLGGLFSWLVLAFILPHIFGAFDE